MKKQFKIKELKDRIIITFEGFSKEEEEKICEVCLEIFRSLKPA